MNHKDNQGEFPSKFNVRVYGVYVKEGALLVSDEHRMQMNMTKLPGGGVEFGEGVEQALAREWKEELDTRIDIGDVLYVNPFFQRSAFDACEQVLCLYYRITCLEPLKGKFVNKPFAFPVKQEGAQVFRWVPLRELAEDEFTFPIDQSLVPVLKQRVY